MHESAAAARLDDVIPNSGSRVSNEMRAVPAPSIGDARIFTRKKMTARIVGQS